MNTEQILGLIRQFLPFASGIAAALGWTWFDGLAASVLQVIGPLGGLISLIWSLVSKTNANLVTTAASVPGVAHIMLLPNEAGKALAPNSVTPPNVTLPSGVK